MKVLIQQIISSKFAPHLLFLTFFGILLIGLGSTHLFDWDEINFAESSREMLVTGDYLHVQINFLPFWEKPPLFFWIQGASMGIFGVSEFAARFPNAVLGLIYLITLYIIGKKHHSKRFGLFWALLFFCSLLPHVYFKSGIIDPLFNYFIFLSIYFMIMVIQKPTAGANKNALASGLFSGLSVLTKGPVGFLLLALTLLVFLVIKKFKPFPRLTPILLFFAGLLSIIALWLGAEYVQNGFETLTKFVTYQVELFNSSVAGHEQPFYYHFLVIFFGCFPMSILALPAFKKQHQGDPSEFKIWMLCLFWVVLILFSIVTTKIIHYSSMTYIPLAFLAAITLERHHANKSRPPSAALILVGVIGLLVGLIICAVPFIFINAHEFSHLFADQFTLDSLLTPVSWTGKEFLFGLVFCLTSIVAVIFLWKKRIIEGLMALTFGTIVTVICLQLFVLPKIEGHTQGPMIEFCESIQDEDCYIETYGFKSYAHYYYATSVPASDSNNRNLNWLINGNIDKRVYIVTKSSEDALDKNPSIHLIKKHGGFKFYSREPAMDSIK